MPPDPITVYNLGELGVNLVKSPIHLEDGELVAAQNAEFYREQGRGAIRKRPALRRYNSSVLAGTISGAIGVPLAGPGRRSVYAQKPATPFFRKTTDGTTWANDSGFQTSPQNSGIILTEYPMLRAAIVKGQFFYPVGLSDVTNAAIYGYDGDAEFEFVRMGDYAGNTRTLCQHGGQVVFTAKYADDTTTRAGVFLADPVTGAVTQIGSGFDSTPGTGIEVVCGVSYQGKIWIGTSNLNGVTKEAKLYSASPVSTAWTTERTTSGHYMYSSLAVRNGELFAGTWIATAGTAAIVEKRTAGGTWSTSQTGGSTTTRNRYDGLITWNGDLYAIYNAPDHAGTPILRIEKFNGSAWSTDKDLQAAGEVTVAGVVAVGLALYYNAQTAIASHVWRKTPTVTWTLVDTTSGTPTTGVMGVI